MEMVDMGKSSSEFSVQKSVLASESPYPIGLSIRLEEEEIKKLGIDSPPSVGEKMELEAIAEVRSVSTTDDSSNGKKREICLQITKLSICKCDAEEWGAKEEKKTPYGYPAGTLYYMEDM